MPTPVIYLVPRSPQGSSILPSAVAKQLGGQPSICGIHELAASRWHSLTITRQLVVSYTTFSPLPKRFFISDEIFGGYFLLPTPTVTNSFYFRKWSVLCRPDFPLTSFRCKRQSRNAAFLKQERIEIISEINPFFLEVPSRVELLYTVLQTVT